MHLLPREIDKLTVATLGQLAQARLARGLRLNAPEAISLITFVLHELARDGIYTGQQLSALGRNILGRRQVVPAVFSGPGAVCIIQLEPTLPTGTALVSVHNPIDSDFGNVKLALYAHWCPLPSQEKLESMFPPHPPEKLRPENAPGAVIYSPGDVEFNGSIALPIEAAPGGTTTPVITDGDEKSLVRKQSDDEVGLVRKQSKDEVARRPRRRIRLAVTNTGDRPVQIGSHYPFIEINPQMQFDRLRSFGFRLDIPSGTSVRFEPGITKLVTLTEMGGKGRIRGGNGFASYILTGQWPLDLNVSEWTDFPRGGTADSGEIDVRTLDVLANPIYQERAQRAAAEGRFLHRDSTGHLPIGMPMELKPPIRSRAVYGSMYGPSTGDRVRLGATDLWICIEDDLTIRGDECTFGAGKTIRDGMGQASGRSDAEVADLVITNVIILDWSGIYKADIAIKNGRITGIGKAGNPDTMEGVGEHLIVGCGTDVLAGEGMIVTAGAIDTHIHWICPQQADDALMSGVTTMIGGGTGPTSGSNATTGTPGAGAVAMMIQALDSLPLNYGVTGKGNDSGITSMMAEVEAGALGLKLHEDYGCTPAAIDSCLRVCDQYDIQCLIHTDTINESGFAERTMEAIAGRTIHTYHSEGAGGGHAPDILKVVSLPHVVPSSTNPTRPLTSSTVEEHLDMVMVCHHLNPNIPEDVAFAESRIRENTIAAEDVLHDLGAISIMSSDSQAMGRCGEVILRTWHTAHKNRFFRGTGPMDSLNNDNNRVKRYVSKYTINPALAHGIADHVGSVEVGKFADLVLYRPSRFGVRPEVIVKGGVIAAAAIGDANASIPTVQPIIMRRMFAALGGKASSKIGNMSHTSIAFVSKASMDSGVIDDYGLKHLPIAVKGCRSVSKADMRWNDYVPKTLEVDPEDYRVFADGFECSAPKIDALPMTLDYFVF